MKPLFEHLIEKGWIDGLLKTASPDLDYSDFSLSGDEKVTIRFLGTATFVIQAAGRTLVFDPYVTRPTLREHLKPLVPDRDRIRATFPEADDVFIGHAHSDHILDAPDLCIERDARLIGSPSVCTTGRAAGVPEHLLHEITSDRQVVASNEIRITALQSKHGIVTQNRLAMKAANRALTKIKTPDPNRCPPPMFEDSDPGVLFPRDTRDDLQWPAYTWEMGCGTVYDWLVDIGGTKIMHIDSARIVPGELDGLRADIVCLCAMGRKHAPKSHPNFTKSIIESLRPRVIIPCHWDNFFAAPHPNGALTPLRSAKIRSWMRELNGLRKTCDSLEAVHLLRYEQSFGV